MNNIILFVGLLVYLGSKEFFLLRHSYVFDVFRMFYKRSSTFSDLQKKIYNFRRDQIAYKPKSYLTAYHMSYSTLYSSFI